MMRVGEIFDVEQKLDGSVIFGFLALQIYHIAPAS